MHEPTHKPRKQNKTNKTILSAYPTRNKSKIIYIYWWKQFKKHKRTGTLMTSRTESTLQQLKSWIPNSLNQVGYSSENKNKKDHKKWHLGMTLSNIYSSQRRAVRLPKKTGKTTIHTKEATKQLKPCALKKNTQEYHHMESSTRSTWRYNIEIL